MIYFTHPKTGSVHLAGGDHVARWGGNAKTFCGRPTSDLDLGDETLSATCGACLLVARLKDTACLPPRDGV